MKNKSLLIVVILVILLGAFSIGKSVLKAPVIENEPVLQVDSIQNTSTQPVVTKEVTPNESKGDESSSFNPFISGPREKGISSIVGYFANGSFYWYLPDWVEQNWKIEDFGTEGMRLTPKAINVPRAFSDIVIAVNPSTEDYNASTLYESDRSSTEGQLLINEVLLNKHANESPTIVMETNTRIYHVQRQIDNKIYDRYYIDGSGGKTAYVSFSVQTEEYYKYGTAVRELVEGIGMGETPQG